MLVFDFLLYILITGTASLILNQMEEKEKVTHDFNDGIYRTYRECKYSNHDFISIGLPFIFAIIVLFIHSICSSYLYKLIKFRTNLTYIEYLTMKNKIIIDNAINSPQNQTNTNLNYIGNDQNGNPILIKNVQFITPPNQIQQNKNINN